MNIDTSKIHGKVGLHVTQAQHSDKSLTFVCCVHRNTEAY